MKRHGSTIWVVTMFLLCARTGGAQVTTGTILGTVTDSTGAVLPGAKIEIRNEDTGASRAVTSDAAGRYSAPSLGLGNYRVTASLEGFQAEVRSGIVLTVGREAVVNFQLSVGAVAQSVEVTGEAPLVQTTESTVSYLVEDRTIRDLPLNGRDLTQLILLNPGVIQTVNSPQDRAYNGWGKSVSISGFRREDNSYLLDGSYIVDYSRRIPAGPSGALFGAETVREFQVLTNSYGAQYGRVMGGVFNAVSKSGTNEWHGDIYEFLRNSALDARKFFDRKRFPSDPRLPPFRRNQFGGTVGGPIVRDKTFFFVAYEGLREALTTTNYSNVPDPDARRGILPGRTVQVSSLIARYLQFFPLPSPQGKNFGDGTAQLIFTARQPSQDDFGQGRLDHQFSENDSSFLRFTASNSSQSQVLAYPDFGYLGQMDTRLTTLSETHIFSPRALSTSRFSFNRVVPVDKGTYPEVPADLLSVPGQPPPGLSPGSGIATWEGFPKPRDSWVTNRFNFQNDVNLSLGTYTLQLGGMIERMQFNMDQPNRPFGEWGFASLADFLQGIPNVYRGTPPQYGSSVRGWRQWFFALYAQADWQVRPRLTVNLGLRWEPYTPPDEVNGLIANLRHLGDAEPTVGAPYWRNKSWRDIGPRLGFAWSPFEMGKTSLRGSFGLFFLPNDGTQYYIPATRSAPTFPELQFTSPTHFPDALAEIASQRITSFGTAEAIPYENNKSPRSLQWNLNMQQQLGTSNVVTLGYVGSRGINLTAYGNYNSPAATFNGISLEVPANATLLNPKFQNIYYYANRANSWYNALAVTFQRRFSAGLQAQVSYTFSRAISEADSTSKTDASGAGSGTVPYTYDLKVTKGLSGYHVGRKLNINYSYDLPLGRAVGGFAGYVLSGWQLTGIITLQDGQPFNISSGTPRALANLLYSQRPNVDSSFRYDQIVQGGPDQYFNPLAFTLPKTLELGNVGRNTLIGPGLVQWDLGLTKNTSLTEPWRLQFRAEFFNLLNRPNFSNPSASIFSGSGQRVGSAGSITNTVSTARQIQFGLKLLF